jgi:hypothetical protein
VTTSYISDNTTTSDSEVISPNYCPSTPTISFSFAYSPYPKTTLTEPFASASTAAGFAPPPVTVSITPFATLTVTVKTTTFLPSITDPPVTFGPSSPPGGNGKPPGGFIHQSSSTAARQTHQGNPPSTVLGIGPGEPPSGGDIGTGSGPGSSGSGSSGSSSSGSSSSSSGSSGSGSSGSGSSGSDTSGSGSSGPGSSDSGTSSPHHIGGSGVVVNSVTALPGASGVVLGGTTYSGGPTASPVVIGGHTWTILPSGGGVVAPGGITVPSEPTITPGPIVNINGQSFSPNPNNPSQVIVSGETIQIPSQGSTIVTVAGSIYTVDQNGISQGSNTVAFAPAVPTFIATSVDGIPVDVGTSLAIVSDSTVDIGAGATNTTLIFGSETVVAGPHGLEFPYTTIQPLPSSVVVSGMTIEIQPSDAIIGGTTYFFNSSTVVTVSGQAITVGPSGIIFPSTTLSPTFTSIPTSASALPTLSKIPIPTASATPTGGAGSNNLGLKHLTIISIFLIVVFAML